MTCFNTQHYNYSNMATWGGFDRINEAVLRFHLLQFLLHSSFFSLLDVTPSSPLPSMWTPSATDPPVCIIFGVFFFFVGFSSSSSSSPFVESWQLFFFLLRFTSNCYIWLKKLKTMQIFTVLPYTIEILRDVLLLDLQKIKSFSLISIPKIQH